MLKLGLEVLSRGLGAVMSSPLGDGKAAVRSGMGGRATPEMSGPEKTQRPSEWTTTVRVCETLKEPGLTL